MELPLEYRGILAYMWAITRQWIAFVFENIDL